MSNTAKINQQLFLFVFKYIKNVLISAFLKCELFLLFLITFDSKLEIIKFSDFFKKQLEAFIQYFTTFYTHFYQLGTWQADRLLL